VTKFKARRNTIALDKQNLHRTDKIKQTNEVPYGDPLASFAYAYNLKNHTYSPGKEKKISFAE
jgi:hypothetical protein